MIETANFTINPDPQFEEALCAQTDPDLWFPEPNESPSAAKRVCARCPVRAPCLRKGLALQVQYGIWGGATLDELRDMRTGRKRRHARRNTITDAA